MYPDTNIEAPINAGNASQTERIVDYLIKTLRIPEGNHLVDCFGAGNERSNRDAMRTWVLGLSHEYNADEAEYRLARLVLHAQLESPEEAGGTA